MVDAHGYNNNSLGSHGNLIKVTSQACVHNPDIYAYIYLYIHYTPPHLKNILIYLANQQKQNNKES